MPSYVIEHRRDFGRARPIQGRSLGRVVQHDSRSKLYRVVTQPVIGSKRWTRRVPIFDQGQVGSCHDSDTEILTRQGWLPFTDLTLENELATVNPATRELHYERPTRIIAMPYSGDVHSVQNRGHNFRVTADHSMLVRQWDERARKLSENYTFTPMKDLGWYAGLMTTVQFAGTSSRGDTYTLPGIPNYKRASQRNDLEVPLTAWLGFLGIYLAEGTMLKPSVKSPHKVQIAAFKPREKAFVRNVFAELGIKALELRDRFTFENARIYQHLESLGLKGVYASEKFVPDFVFGCSGQQIGALLEGHREGDGSLQNGCWTHYTSSPQLADDLQRLIFLAGGKTGVSARAARGATMTDGREVRGVHPSYEVRHLKGTQSSIERKRDVKIEHYDGMVYCAEVPTFHTLVTRRNGHILISGNCTGNATVGVLGTDPFYLSLAPKLAAGLVLDETEAVSIYSAAEIIDGGKGMPSEDQGSSGLSVAKAAKNAGLISGYTHALSFTDFLSGMQTAPGITGITWLTGCDTPDDNGLVKWSGKVRGGHEVEVDEIDVDKELVWFDNSWSTTYGVAGRFAMSFADYTKALADQGDVTFFTPLSQPAPIPTPAPPAPDPSAVQRTLTFASDSDVASAKAFAAGEHVLHVNINAKKAINDGTWS